MNNTVQTVKQVIWSEMTDAELQYQVDAFERHDDVYGSDYRQLVLEYRKRGLQERGNWRDIGELRAGA